MSLPSVAYVHYSCPPVIGGVEFVLRAQAEHTADAGMKCRVVVGAGEQFHPDVPVTVVPELSATDESARRADEAIRSGDREAFDAVVDKWYGIEKLCRRWRIDPGRTVAVGDDVNDLPMIQNAGLGVAVANAKPAVKQVAAQVVAANDEAGVADLIEQLPRG